MTDWVTHLGDSISRASMTAILVLRVNDHFGSNFMFMFGSAIWEFDCFKFLTHFTDAHSAGMRHLGWVVAVDQKWVSWEILGINCGLRIKSWISRQPRPESLVIGDG